MKKIISVAITIATLFTTSAFAKTPAEYSQQRNLAVIANSDVNIYGDSAYIAGSVYSNGTIYCGNGDGNKVDGIFISSTKNTIFESNGNKRTAAGYIHVNDEGTTEGINYYSTAIEVNGAIYDDDTSFNCVFPDFSQPAITNVIEDGEMTVYYNDIYKWSEEKGSYTEPGENAPQTISLDTQYNNLTMNGTLDNWRNLDAAMIIDVTSSDVNIIINNFTATNPTIKTIGNHNANIYINNTDTFDNFTLTGNINLYLTNSEVTINHSNMNIQNIYVSSNTFSIGGASNIVGDIYTNALLVNIYEAAQVTGTVCAPSAYTNVINSGIIYGQLHTDKLKINGAGQIIYKIDDISIDELPTGTEIDLSDINYAYIFGYEPEYTEDSVIIKMAPDDAVTGEQVATMLMRLIDQKYNTYDVDYPIASKYKGTWYARGLGYLASKGLDEITIGSVTRREVAKIITYGLNLTDREETPFKDVTNDAYIETVYAYGYMEGVNDNYFEPDRIMTRAEFCKMMNNIIDRNDYELITSTGEEITQNTYHIVDLNGHWARSTMLKATSAYDENGYVDLELRNANIRNVLDQYDDQLEY